jgi:hypothetical protein
MGLGHSAAYVVGAIVLAVGLARRTGASMFPAVTVRIAVMSITVGLAAWAASEGVLGSDPSRVASLAGVLVGATAGGLALLGGYYVLGVRRGLSPRHGPTPALLEQAPDLPPAATP